MAHAQVIAQVLRCCERSATLFFSSSTRFESFSLVAVRSLDDDLALLELGVSASMLSSRRLMPRSSDSMWRLAVDGLLDGLLRFLQAIGVLGFELLGLLEVGRELLLQLVEGVLAFLASAGELRALSLEVEDPRRELAFLLVVASDRGVARFDRLLHAEQRVFVVG